MNSDGEVLVSAWVKIGNTASVDYNVYRDGTVEFSVGGDDAFMLVTTERGLQNFLVHAEEALRAVRAAIARNDGGRLEHDAGEDQHEGTGQPS